MKQATTTLEILVSAFNCLKGQCIHDVYNISHSIAYKHYITNVIYLCQSLRNKILLAQNKKIDRISTWPMAAIWVAFLFPGD